MADRRFVRYDIKIERIDETDVTKREWKECWNEGDPKRPVGKGTYDYVTYPGVERTATEVLSMQVGEEIDLKAVVRTILGISQ